jgi:hypothetical protein
MLDATGRVPYGCGGTSRFLLHNSPPGAASCVRCPFGGLAGADWRREAEEHQRALRKEADERQRVRGIRLQQSLLAADRETKTSLETVLASLRRFGHRLEVAITSASLTSRRFTRGWSEISLWAIMSSQSASERTQPRRPCSTTNSVMARFPSRPCSTTNSVMARFPSWPVFRVMAPFPSLHTAGRVSRITPQMPSRSSATPAASNHAG